MSATHLSDQDISGAPMSTKDRQAPLMKSYVSEPELAWIIDSATTSSEDVPANQPIHTQVTFGMGIPASQRIGVHRAVGGESDFPNPGEVLSAALASCLDTTIRIIANRMGVSLIRLQVKADAGVDVRGTLRVDPQVPVGFQKIDVSVHIATANGVTDAQLGMLLKAAEYSCVVLQTLRNSPEIRINCEPVTG